MSAIKPGMVVYICDPSYMGDCRRITLQTGPGRKKNKKTRTNSKINP
jgi:hypothetical protein